MGFFCLISDYEFVFIIKPRSGVRCVKIFQGKKKGNLCRWSDKSGRLARSYSCFGRRDIQFVNQWKQVALTLNLLDRYSPRETLFLLGLMFL